MVVRKAVDTTDASSRESDGQTIASQAGLRYVSDDETGIRRHRAGQGFTYLDGTGTRITADATLERIRGLAVPPAWTDVWICRLPSGHLQATGRDARGRKQYRYHPEWARVRGDGKFDRIVAFGAALPRLRRRLRADLKLPGFPEKKVIAIVIALMADSLARVGNGSYARDNRSYGLTTLRNRHIAFLRGGRAVIDFRGKSGIEQQISIDDARLVKLVRRCQQLPGHQLFQYRDDDGTLRPVDSGQVNAYLRDAMGESFTAKDFRTWGGTLAAFREFAAIGPPDDPEASSVPSQRNEVIEIVAETLCNTPAVCRKAYIDPVVFEGWLDGRVARASVDARGARQWEKVLLKFLRAAHRSGKRPRR